MVFGMPSHDPSLSSLVDRCGDPLTPSRDLTEHFLYCFNQLSGQSGFACEGSDAALEPHRQAVRAIVANPSWNYTHSVAQLTAGFHPSVWNRPTDANKRWRCVNAFDTLLAAMGEENRSRFLAEEMDVLQRVGATTIPWVMAQVLTTAVGQAGRASRPLKL